MNVKGKHHEIKLGRLAKDDSAPPPAKKTKSTGNNDCLPNGPWELNKSDINLADQRANSIRYTPTSSLKPASYFTNSNLLCKMEMDIKVKYSSFSVHN